MAEVTKTKSEGRIAAGKRLAEWNRKNKEDLLKNKEQVLTQVNSSGDQVSTSRDQVLASHASSVNRVYGGIIFLIVSGIYYFYTHRKAPPVPEPVLQLKKWMD